jgi:uncharacterized MAPEG superfamily protein
MSQEFFWLALTVAMTGLMWVPYILDRIATRGLMGTFANPGPELAKQSDWAERMKAAHYNAVENLMVFAPLILMLHALSISTTATVAAAATYFWARLVHFVVYTMGLPVVRTLAFAVGFFAQAVLLLALFGVM